MADENIYCKKIVFRLFSGGNIVFAILMLMMKSLNNLHVFFRYILFCSVLWRVNIN